MTASKQLIIFEGPDGAGKSTLAARVAAVVDAELVHCGPYPQVTTDMDLARLYVEAMMPAVLGHRNVVMDRCWISERPYGDAFRGGAYRLRHLGRALERLAWRCETSVILCLPPWDTVATNFMLNKSEQMLDRVEQLRSVYNSYTNYENLTSLPVTTLDPFTADDPDTSMRAVQQAMHSVGHNHPRTAGNLLGAKVLMVVPDAPPHDIGDTLYQWPFGDLSDARGSGGRAMAAILDNLGISERRLYWAFASDVTSNVASLALKVVAVGKEPASRLAIVGRTPDLELPDIGDDYPPLSIMTFHREAFEKLKELV